MSDLKILFPEPVTVEVMGRKIQIKPVLMRDFERYGKASGALIAVLSSASAERVSQYAEKEAAQLRKMLRAATNLNWWQVRRLPSSVAVMVMVEVVRVNCDFFAEALPAMERALSGAMSFSG